jgi:hypothetical protein
MTILVGELFGPETTTLRFDDDLIVMNPVGVQFEWSAGKPGRQARRSCVPGGDAAHMKARDLSGPQPSVQVDTPASQAARIVAKIGVRAVMVLEADGRLAGILSDAVWLRHLLPSYVEETETLVGVLEERAAEMLRIRLEGRTAGDLLPENQEAHPEVEAGDTLIEVAFQMVRARSPLVAVREGDRIIGGITIDRLINELLAGT